MIGQSIGKNGFVLGAFALVTAGLLAFTFLSTAEKISEQERKAAQKALFEIVPEQRHDNDLLEDYVVLSTQQSVLLNLEESEKIHIARQQNQAIAVIVPSVASDGYSGAIKLLVGINIDGSIAGVRTLSHRETPGLGDKIDLKKDTWILGFNGMNLTNPTIENWAVKKDGGHFDQFTGATITPRAVVNQVKETLLFFDREKDNLLGKTNSELGEEANDKLP